MKLQTRIQRLLGIALALALLGSLTLAGASGLAVVEQELLVNGNFEGGFTYVPGCGQVGNGWGCFTNGGTVDYGFYDDQWQPVVASGAHSQLIELNTMQYAASQADRYAGIYQSVKLVKGQNYQLQLKGLMREPNASRGDDKWRYRVQWGYTTDGTTDWTKVGNWAELPWDKIDERTSPSGLQSFSTTFAAPSDKLTLFIRVWKKWGTAYRDLEVNLDAISLFGLAVQPQPVVIGGPVVVLPGPGEVVIPATAPPPITPGACGGPSMIYNGSFENGFTGGVGKGWTAFNNGGRAAYGFYDEQWSSVIKDGAHGQLIEINTLGMAASDPNRSAGIYQVVGGLARGATYEFSLWGMMRERTDNSAEDKYRYRVQWGYAAADQDPSEADVTNWTELPWDSIYLRTGPGSMAYFAAKFQVPSDKVVIAVRAWKKWGTAGRELDVNLDAIKLTGCGCPRDGGPIVIPPPQADCTWVTVARGDTVFGLAMKYNSSVALIMERNKLANPNLIYVGQKLCIVDP
ncbi:MAG: LysM peptidoglycan-binding domain-containing protein [Chloroflexi bacterium]|nr:LysM peptidoglycan-binding domain-containing protein [Chloroflexota bacterium]